MADSPGIDRISPLWLGIGISGSLVAMFMISETLLGRWDLLLVDEGFDPLARVTTGILRDLRISIVHCLLVGYLPAALLHVLRNGQRTVATSVVPRSSKPSRPKPLWKKSYTSPK